MFYYWYFFKKQFYFFKKRYLLIKFWKNFFQKSVKVFFRRNLNYFFTAQYMRRQNKLRKPWYRFISKIYYSIFLKKKIKNLFFKSFFLKKTIWQIYLRKFNFLKKYFFSNINQYFYSNCNNSKFLKIFLNLKFFSNINFFLLHYFQLKNIFYKICFFFNWVSAIAYITHIGLFINGLKCQNILFFCNPLVFNTYQLVWSVSFYRFFIIWYNYYIWQRWQIPKINWLYFFRRYVQKKTYRYNLPKWIYKWRGFIWCISKLFEVSFISLSFFILPIYWNLVNSFFIRFLNIYNHRLYLWKYVI